MGSGKVNPSPEQKTAQPHILLSSDAVVLNTGEADGLHRKNKSKSASGVSKMDAQRPIYPQRVRKKKVDQLYGGPCTSILRFGIENSSLSANMPAE